MATRQIQVDVFTDFERNGKHFLVNNYTIPISFAREQDTSYVFTLSRASVVYATLNQTGHRLGNNIMIFLYNPDIPIVFPWRRKSNGTRCWTIASCTLDEHHLFIHRCTISIEFFLSSVWRRLETKVSNNGHVTYEIPGSLKKSLK